VVPSIQVVFDQGRWNGTKTVALGTDRHSRPSGSYRSQRHQMAAGAAPEPAIPVVGDCDGHLVASQELPSVTVKLAGALPGDAATQMVSSMW